MNKNEAMEKVKDFVLGPRVEGTICAYLPSESNSLSHKFAVREENGEVLEVDISDIETVFGFINVFREPIIRGQKVNLRAIKTKPWVDGQIVQG